MRRTMIAVAAAALILTPIGADAMEPRVDVALVFVVDCSSSMDSRENELVRAAHREAILSDDVLGAVRELPSRRAAMAFVEFTRFIGVAIVGWTVVRDRASAEDFVAGFEAHAPCSGVAPATNTPVAEGLQAALTLIQNLPYEADRIVVDVVGDGIDNAGVPDDNGHSVSLRLAPVRKELLDLGAVINGLPMVLDSAEAAYLFDWYCGDGETILPAVRGGYGSFCKTLDRIEDLPIQLRHKIVEELY